MTTVFGLLSNAFFRNHLQKTNFIEDCTIKKLPKFQILKFLKISETQKKNLRTGKCVTLFLEQTDVYFP